MQPLPLFIHPRCFYNGGSRNARKRPHHRCYRRKQERRTLASSPVYHYSMSIVPNRTKSYKIVPNRPKSYQIVHFFAENKKTLHFRSVSPFNAALSQRFPFNICCKFLPCFLHQLPVQSILRCLPYKLHDNHPPAAASGRHALSFS